MSPERAADLVRGWVRRYTRELDAPLAQRRIAEIDADLHDHIEHERARGTGDGRIALAILSRMVRGIPADSAWRDRALARTTDRRERPKMHRSVVRVAVVTGLLLLIPAIGMVAGDGNTDWGVFDFVFAAVLLAGAGTIIELALRRPGRLVFRVAAAALGVAAMAFGEADDAPGLFGFGLLLILGAVALQVRTARSA